MKIEGTFDKWNKHYLSMAGRLQLFQKILASYNIYFSSVWFFSSYQVNEIQKKIRGFLWSDEKGKKKKHTVKWDTCCLNKEQGD